MNEVINFWFSELTPKQHFVKDAELDAEIKRRFEELYWAVLKGEKANWRSTAEGRLAEVIVLDQFARNIFRNDPQAFAGDYLALALSQESIRCGHFEDLSPEKRVFMIMPFMHSESLHVHDMAMKLFSELNESTYKYEIKHRDIIAKFGRYPHRNQILDRKTTDEEVEFLKDNPGF